MYEWNWGGNELRIPRIYELRKGEFYEWNGGGNELRIPRIYGLRKGEWANEGKCFRTFASFRISYPIRFIGKFQYQETNSEFRGCTNGERHLTHPVSHIRGIRNSFPSKNPKNRTL